jgi:hypothetical protein
MLAATPSRTHLGATGLSPDRVSRAGGRSARAIRRAGGALLSGAAPRRTGPWSAGRMHGKSRMMASMGRDREGRAPGWARAPRSGGDPTTPGHPTRHRLAPEISDLRSRGDAVRSCLGLCWLEVLSRTRTRRSNRPRTVRPRTARPQVLRQRRTGSFQPRSAGGGCRHGRSGRWQERSTRSWAATR